VGDGALNPRQAFEQFLALLQALEQSLIELGLHLGVEAVAALVAGQPEEAEREAEHAPHAAREMELVDREAAPAAACENQRRGRVVLHVDRQGGALTESRGHQGRGSPLGHLGQGLLEARVAGEADRHIDLPLAQQRGDLGIEGLGSPLNRQPARGALVARRRHRRHEAGELLG
jgi:hypothetical protein